MKKIINYSIIFIFVMSIAAFTAPHQQKTYKIELTSQEVQVVYDALGELPAKVTEGIRAKVAKQVQEQNGKQ